MLFIYSKQNTMYSQVMERHPLISIIRSILLSYRDLSTADLLTRVNTFDLWMAAAAYIPGGLIPIYTTYTNTLYNADGPFSPQDLIEYVSDLRKNCGGALLRL